MTTSNNPINQQLVPTQRTQIKRLPKRGNYETQVIYNILDEALICHVGFTVDNQPFVIPTAYGRVADKLYIHGSPASRMLRNLTQGIEVCVTVTLLDGLVLARSAFHHSMNYRSVVIFGMASLVNDTEEKNAALRAFTEQVIPQRWEEVRQPSKQELQGTMVLSLPLNEASAKIRTGNPVDDESDYNLPVWAGVLPLQMVAGKAINDQRLIEGIEIPDYVRNYREARNL
ncbi:pyridoxamine 5'-phosphate oxidase family protein [Plectonema cf. radiosum LEGE 06105]|uniref:Pyridoxamine 5'-phosphate oxidase family protein n=1 Tax=Plectonema cf. radiosum LEGE 06105 TaxID=945769 RepID=A0A8J7JVN0_9CYAN|nr:pyridoxamine 5'-phosphate oxidase family protein [Plectonema radiosum]MBE9214750.1 pyridoxamine 5'-phosphate oxidase family protein [Plectonema cf. radiosum LEGE 06105]